MGHYAQLRRVKSPKLAQAMLCSPIDPDLCTLIEALGSPNAVLLLVKIPTPKGTLRASRKTIWRITGSRARRHPAGGCRGSDYSLEPGDRKYVRLYARGAPR